MIYRIVKMTFRPDATEQFLEVFESSREKIRAFPGCNHLELWRDENDERTFFTYSWWDADESLQAYRQSELFRSTWAKTKILFEAKPQAWTVNGLYKL